MITFNIQAGNGNYYRGHEPANGCGNCWCGEEKDALVFTIEQARELVSAWRGFLKIVIAVSSIPASDEVLSGNCFVQRVGDGMIGNVPLRKINKF